MQQIKNSLLLSIKYTRIMRFYILIYQSIVIRSDPFIPVLYVTESTLFLNGLLKTLPKALCVFHI